MARNYKGRARTLKHDDWFYLEQLPQPIRLRLMAATMTWSSSWILSYYRKAVKRLRSEAAAERHMMTMFDHWDQHQADKLWIKPPVGQKAEPSPCRQAGVRPLVTRFSCTG